VDTAWFVNTAAGRGRAVPLGLLGSLTLVLLGCSHNDDYYCCAGPVNVPNSVAIADVSGDGAQDLLVATTNDQYQPYNPGFANVILNSQAAPGTFQKGVPYPITGSNPASIAVADLTGAGALDLVVANFSGSVSVFLHGSTPGTFQAGYGVITGGAPNQVVIADLNGDGSPDLVVADFSANGSVIVLLQDPANPGHFQAPIKLPTGAATASAQVADLNGDGLPDIVATGYDYYGNNGAVYVFYQSSGGNFLPPVSYPAGAGPQSVKVADMNHDGLPDLVVADFGPGTDGRGIAGVSVILQTATHQFLTPNSYPTPPAAIDVAIADLDGDGKPDVAVATLGPSPSGTISVLLQDPGKPGALLAATTYAAFGQPLGIAIGDLNHDGLPDIAAADGTSATVMLQLAGQPGTFAAPVQVGQ